MSTSTVLCHSYIFCTRKKKGIWNSLYLHDSLKFDRLVQLEFKPRRLSGFICNSNADSNSNWSHSGSEKSKSVSWWKRFFYDVYDANWVGLKGDDMLETVNPAEEDELSEAERFEAWKRRVEAIMEIREAQQDLKNEGGKRWEDWLVEQETAWTLYQFGYLSNYVQAKFLAMLIIIPCAMDFVVHDYVLMPFLDRYVRTVPLAAKMLDVRRSQKLKMVDELKTERARYQLEIRVVREVETREP